MKCARIRFLQPSAPSYPLRRSPSPGLTGKSITHCLWIVRSSRTMTWCLEIILLSLFFLSSGILSADDQRLPSAESLFLKAGKGRIDFLDVVSEIQELIPDLRTREEAERYLKMLSPLSALAKELRFDEWGSDPVSELGKDLSRHALARGWLILENADAPTLLLYHQWSDPADAFDYILAFKNSFEPLKNQSRDAELPMEEFRHVISNLDILLSSAKEKNRPDYLLVAYRQLKTNLAALVLERKLHHLSQEEKGLWASNLAIAQGVSDFLFFLENEALQIREPEKEKIHAIVDYLLLIPYLDTEKYGFSLSSQTRQSLGEVAVTSILTMIEFEEKFEEGEFEDLLGLLSPAHFASLIDAWINLKIAPSPEFSEILIQKSRLLIGEVHRRGMKSEGEKIERYLSSTLGTSLFSRHRNFEGTYEVLLDGEKYLFTFIQAKDNMLLAGLSNHPDNEQLRGIIQYAFFDIRYNYEKQRFEGSQRPRQETDYHHNDLIRFSFEGGRVRGNLLFRPGIGTFEGEKSENYNDYFMRQLYPSPSIEGVYEAAVFRDGKERKYRLSLYSHGNEVIGRWTEEESGTVYYTNFEMGLIDPHRGIIYMTKGGQTLTNWLHFRGYLTEGQLIGQFIMGGKGLMKYGPKNELAEFLFRKISD